MALGRYRIQSVLDESASVRVLGAVDLLAGRPVTLKVFDRTCRQASAALHREQAAYARVRDFRHVLRCWDVQELSVGPSVFPAIVLEHVEGPTLKQWLVEHRSDWDRRCTQGLALMKQAVAGVGAVHQAGVLHLALDPARILLSGDGAKIADFGWSWVRDSNPPQVSQAEEFTTSQRHQERFAGHLSPEQREGVPTGNLDERADLYSVGVMLHQVLHPHARVPDGTAGQQASPSRETGDSRVFLAGITRPRAKVVERCLCADRQGRYDSASELLAAFASADADAGRIAGWWAAAREAWRSRRLLDARRLSEMILGIDDSHEGAKQLVRAVRQVDERVATVCSSLERAWQDGSTAFESLCATLGRTPVACRHLPCVLALRQRLVRHASGYRDAMTSAIALAARGAWTQAEQALGQAKETQVNAPLVDGAISTLRAMRHRIDETGQRIRSAERRGDRRQLQQLQRELAEAWASWRRHLGA